MKLSSVRINYTCSCTKPFVHTVAYAHTHRVCVCACIVRVCNHVFYIYPHPDIDECLMDVCHVNATCSNTAGSYECTCQSGFSGDGLTCTGSCSNNIKCMQIFVSFSITDVTLYRLNGLFLNCLQPLFNPYLTLPSADINECETTDSCGENAVCNNTDGNYTCSCNTGYSGDGRSCMGMLWGYKSQ